MSQNGKGDKPRPLSIAFNKFTENLERTLNVPTRYNISDMKDDRIELEVFEGYLKLLSSGMFFELHPELTGDWKTDKLVWYSIYLTKDSQELGLYET